MTEEARERGFRLLPFVRAALRLRETMDAALHEAECLATVIHPHSQR